MAAHKQIDPDDDPEEEIRDAFEKYIFENGYREIALLSPCKTMAMIPIVFDEDDTVDFALAVIIIGTVEFYMISGRDTHPSAMHCYPWKREGCGHISLFSKPHFLGDGVVEVIHRVGGNKYIKYTMTRLPPW